MKNIVLILLLVLASACGGEFTTEGGYSNGFGGEAGQDIDLKPKASNVASLGSVEPVECPEECEHWKDGFFFRDRKPLLGICVLNDDEESYIVSELPVTALPDYIPECQPGADLVDEIECQQLDRISRYTKCERITDAEDSGVMPEETPKEEPVCQKVEPGDIGKIEPGGCIEGDWNVFYCEFSSYEFVVNEESTVRALQTDTDLPGPFKISFPQGLNFGSCVAAEEKCAWDVDALEWDCRTYA